MGRQSYLHGRIDATWIDDVDIDLEAPTQVEEESIVAHGETRADGSIPNVAETFFSFRAISGDFVRCPRKEVGIVWVHGLPRLALCDTTDSSVDVAIGAFAVVRGAALAVVDDLALLLKVERSRGRGPLPAVHAAISGVVEIVKIYEIGCDGVLVGRDGLRELRQCRIAVTYWQVAQHLIIGTVLSNNVDHMLDVLPQEPHGRGVFAAEPQVETIVLRNQTGQLLEIGCAGHGQN